jgi:hypothetical protein
MKFLKQILLAGCVLALAVGAASAGVNSKEVGALLVYPGYYATDQAEIGGDGTTQHTYLTVTNAVSIPVNAHIEVVGGTACDDCNFDLYLTGFQTRRLLFKREQVGGFWNTVIRDASPHSQTLLGLPVLAACPEAKGFVVALLEAAVNGAAIEPRRTLGADFLYGDEVVVNINSGAALQLGAIAVQDGPQGNNGDRVLAFNNSEYAAFPFIVSANFWAPNSDVDPRLILFNAGINTHRVGGDEPPHTPCSVNYVNANEVKFSRSFSFGCWTDTRLLDPLLLPGSHEDILGTANGFVWVGCEPDEEDRVPAVHGAIATALLGGHENYVYSDQSGFSDTLFQSPATVPGAVMYLTPDITGPPPTGGM